MSKLGIKKKQEGTKTQAQKMMRGRITPSIVPTLVPTGKQSV